MLSPIIRIAAAAAAAAWTLAASAQCPTTSIEPATTLADGSVGSAYSQAFIASGSSATPYGYQVTSGLPLDLGLSMNGGTGELSGTPAKAGTYLLTITGTDTDGCSGGRTYSLTVGKGDQTISFNSTAPADAVVGGATYMASASATSGLTVTLMIDASAASVCSIAGSVVSFIGSGTCVVDANQSGDADWNAAPQAQQSFAVRKSQTISFTSTPSAPAVGGGTYDVTATATSGLTVSFSIDASATSVCSIAGSSVSFLAAGQCVIDANQAGDSTYAPAPQAQQSFSVAQGSQTIMITPPGAPAYGSTGAGTHTYAAAATSTSGLPVAFTIDGTSTSGCSIAANLVTFGAPAGTCVIDADQAGDANWNPAPQVQQTVTVLVPASAGNDSHAVTGNIPIAVAASGVLGNDSGTSIAIVSYGATGSEQTSIGSATATANNGSVAVNADGSYSYDPPANYTGSDSFKYVIDNALGQPSTGTVTLTIADRVIVVASGASGNCKPASPCAMSTADAASPPTGKDLVFVTSGSYASPNATFTLNASQALVGNAVSLAAAIADAGITLAAGSSGPVAVAASTAPVLTNAGNVLTLAGSNLVEHFAITNPAGSAIVANAVSGTSTIRDITVSDGANAGNGVALTSNGSATLNFSDLIVTTSSGAPFSATGGGTVNVTTGSSYNALASTTGTALKVANTTIGASGMTFRSISANGAANGIVLDTTGSSGGLAVTGNSAGLCGGRVSPSAAPAPGDCTGGVIQNIAGSDGTTAGIGVYLNATSNVSLTRMEFNGAGNYAIRGFNVSTFTLDHSYVHGANGNSASQNEGSIAFGANTGEPIPFAPGTGPANGLTGSAAITNSTVQGGFEDNVRVANQSGALNRLTLDGDTIGPNDATNGNDGVLIEGESAATINVTAQNSAMSGARGTLFAFILNGNNTADLAFQNNKLSNPAPYAANTGSNNLTLISGANVSSGATTTFSVTGNTFRDANGHAVLLVKSTDPGTLRGTVSNNTIGVAGIADSGSAAGSGIKIQSAGLGTVTVLVQNNSIYQYNNFGVELLTGGGATAYGGNFNATVSLNTISNPGTSGLPMNGVQLNGGTNVGDTFAICTNIGGSGANTMTGSGTNGGTDFRLRQRQSTTVTLPGYVGANNNDAAVVSYVSGLNAGASGSSSNTVGSGGGGFVNGAPCPVPSG